MLRILKDIVDRVPEKSCDLQDGRRIARIDQRTGSAAGSMEALTGAFPDDQDRTGEETKENCADQSRRLRSRALTPPTRNQGTTGQL